MSIKFELESKHMVHFSLNDARLWKTSEKDVYFSLPEDVDKIFDEIQKSKKKSITLFFHGGLVPSNDFITNKDLALLYNGLLNVTYPIFVVWETGPQETGMSWLADLREHLEKITLTELFKRILPHVIKYKSVKNIKLKGNKLSKKKQVKLLQEPAFFDDEYEIFAESEKQELLTELQADTKLNQELQRIADNAKQKRVGLQHFSLTNLDKDTGYLSNNIVAEIVNDSETKPKLYAFGWDDFTSFFMHILNIVLSIRKRRNKKRDHDDATIIEEVLREIYIPIIDISLDKLGVAIWNQMKDNSVEAYADNKPKEAHPHGGTYLIEKINEYLQKPENADTHINLIGHSAGAIHICHFVEKTAVIIKKANFKFENTVFLAPACDFSVFQKVINNQAIIKKFRIFTMEDGYEKGDVLLKSQLKKIAKYVYPYSLLYFVSGVCEEDEYHDKPILGMERFLNRDILGDFFDNDQDVINARAFLKDRIVYSVTSRKAPLGYRSSAKKHGTFDGNPKTIESLISLIK